MSIYFSGTFTRSAGEISAILKQLQKINLKTVKKIEVQFDPFHPKAVVARDFLFHISKPDIAESNLNCTIKANVVCNRSEPEVNVKLVESGSVRFMLNNLTVLEILQQFNKHISSKVPVEEEPKVLATKSEKKKHKRK